MIRQELYNEAAESLSRDMEEMIVKLQRFTEFVMYGIATPLGRKDTHLNTPPPRCIRNAKLSTE